MKLWKMEAHLEQQSKKPFPWGFFIALAVLGIIYANKHDIKIFSTPSMQDIHNQVAQDAVKQFGIASQSGNAMDVCVQAGLVKAAYLQAQNAKEYASWVDVEKNSCKRAGLPR